MLNAKESFSTERKLQLNFQVTPQPNKSNRTPVVEVFSRTKSSIERIVETCGYGLLDLQRDPETLEQNIIEAASQLMKNREGGRKNTADLFRRPHNAPILISTAIMALLISACASLPSPASPQVNCNSFEPSPLSGVLTFGPNIGPWFIKQAFENTRRIYNRANNCDPDVAHNYIPTTVLISDDDLFRPEFIHDHIEYMLQAGLAPKLRIGTHFRDGRWTRPDESNAEKNGKHLAEALMNIKTNVPIVIQLGNERNLKVESDGHVDPHADARYDYEFLKSLSTHTSGNFKNWEVSLSPQSWGSDGQNGNYPKQYMLEYFSELDRLQQKDPSHFEVKFDSVSLNIYQSNISEMSSMIALQIENIEKYRKFLDSDYYAIDLSELGPINPKTLKAFEECDSEQEMWSKLISQIVKAINQNPRLLGKNIRYITIACFNTRTVPAVIDRNGAHLYEIMP